MSPDATDGAEPFDIAGPLPEGVTLLEASAGTGKTYAIAALAARYIAAGTPIEDLLLVTFGRMATGELRERVRSRLVAVEAALSARLAGADDVHADEVAAQLADGGKSDVRLRRDRLTDAISNFDAATIATIHAFCQEVLGGLGTATELEGESEFIEDVTELREEVVDDLYVWRFSGEANPRMTRAQVAEIAKIAIENPGTKLTEPDDTDEESLPQMRWRLARRARLELDRRKRLAGVMTYDDLLVRLNDALEAPGGAEVAERLAARYSVVLVDEFQDTDPVQWEIFDRAFGDTGRALVLIGDPKQAIYAFRGADVYAYLGAARVAARRATLRANWRSDEGLLEAYDALFSGARLGHDEIVYRDVEAAPPHSSAGLIDAPSAEPLRVRMVRRDEPGIALTKKSRMIQAPAAREHIARDLAAEIVELLSSGARIVTSRDDDGTILETKGARPGHLAVLVPTNRIAAQVREALDDVGVKAVINGAGSVFGTEPAAEWLRLLKAIERPSSASRAHGAALTCFIGWPVERIAAAEDAEWGAVHRRLHAWGRILREGGVASLVEAMTIGEAIPERVLASTDGERRLTDLRHVGQLLHEAASAERLGVSALTSWLHARIEEASHDADEERSRRLESDEEAVQVLTVHRSKGLEFPVVYAPFLWNPSPTAESGEPIAFHDPEAGDDRRLDVSLAGPSFKAHHRQAIEEDRGEDLRLAYVALTRARHQAVIWWAGTHDSRHSPLERLLFARDEDERIKPYGPKTPDDEAVKRRFEEIAELAPGRVSIERSSLTDAGSWRPDASAPPELEVARFDRHLDSVWRRTSYSDISAGAYEHRVASEPELTALADEPDEPAAAAEATATPAADHPPSLMSEIPGGVKLGTFVHEAFERIDFAAPDLAAEVETAVAEGRARLGTEIGDPGALATALAAVIETPLGPALGDRPLRDFGRADRLDELGFELPLAGGDDPTGDLRLEAIADVLREHLPAGDPLAGYADALAEPGLRRTVRGYLNGSLDLVLRVPGDGAGGRPRFAIFDYKTNWLAARGEELTAWHHRPEALEREMRRGQYGLQAILYLATLHRYLRWRMPGYDPETDLAGVYYMFIRGMSGPGTPMIDGERSGVFAWRPPGAAVEALSDVLDGVAA